MHRESDQVWELFTAAVQTAGGLEAMVRERRLGWLPNLMESAYAFLLQEEEHRGLDEIADLVGSTRDSVETILTGPTDVGLARIVEPPPSDPFEREHIAGGIIRHAYRRPEMGAGDSS
jgi:probable regulatory domain-containing protein